MSSKDTAKPQAKSRKKSKIFTKDTLIQHILEQHPDGFTILQEFGLHCIGCALNVFETLEQGVLGHGMPDRTLQEIIQALNSSFRSYQTDLKKKGLVVTDRAAIKIIEIAYQEGRKNDGLRIKVLSKKLKSLSYSMDFESKPKSTDKILEFQHGIRLYVDPSSFKQLRGSRIDYIETFEVSGFKIEPLKKF